VVDGMKYTNDELSSNGTVLRGPLNKIWGGTLNPARLYEWELARVRVAT
jgi:hypothetical protein